MDGLARSLRLMIGLGMIGAGASLAAPAGVQLASWWRASQASPTAWSHEALGIPAPQGLPVEAGQVVQGQVVQGQVVQGQVVQGQVAAAGSWSAGPPPAAQPPRTDYVPPPPPAPLPAVPHGLAAAGPDLASHYRTTLAVPPPPLLDAQRPPPLAVGWSRRGDEDAVGFRGPPAASAAASYRVRDGDDLTAIAIRFYGTPSAAAAIWEANRGILQDPGLLPIGADLALPPPEAIGLVGGADARRSIEPPVGATPVARPAPPTINASWLGRQ